MNKRVIYFSIAFISAAVVIFPFLSASSQSCNNFVSLYPCGLSLPAVFIFIPLSILFTGLGIVQKKHTPNTKAASESGLYSSVHPSILVIIGIIVFLVTFFDRNLGLDLFGFKSLLNTGAGILVIVGLVGLLVTLFKKSNS